MGGRADVDQNLITLTKIELIRMRPVVQVHLGPRVSPGYSPTFGRLRRGSFVSAQGGDLLEPPVPGCARPSSAIRRPSVGLAGTS
jgi:hypothetical protein